MKRNAILSVLVCILLLATACMALPTGGESGSVAFESFSSKELGAKGILPQACQWGEGGQFDCSSLRSGQSPVYLVLGGMPMTLAELIPLLVTDLNLSTVPSSTGKLRGVGLTWELYHFEAPLPDLGPEILRLDLALAEHDSAEHGSVVYIVALLTLPDDYEPHRALYKTVLRYVAQALAPME